MPPPTETSFNGDYVFRYTEQTPQQAIILKLARKITGLRSALILFEEGMFQEQAALQRILDEIGEDIVFLSFGLIDQDITGLHGQFLEAFFKEEFDEGKTPEQSKQKRSTVPRRKIQAYIARVEEKLGKAYGQSFNRSDGVNQLRTVHKAYSGYVHAAAPQIMELYDGEPPRFRLEGLHGTPRAAAHFRDLLNYFYRGLIDAGLAAKALNDEKCEKYLLGRIRSFERLLEAIDGNESAGTRNDKQSRT